MVKDELFKALPESIGTVILDLHDGVIFNLRAKSYENSFRNHIKEAEQRIFEFYGLSITTGIETIRYPVDQKKLDSRKKTKDVRNFLESLDQKMQDDGIPDSDPFIVDDLVRIGLENLGMKENYFPEWHPERLGVFD
jgi:hypothetical protein